MFVYLEEYRLTYKNFLTNHILSLIALFRRIIDFIHAIRTSRINWNRTSLWGDAVTIILLFLSGFGMAVAGGVTLIAYLNFLPAGIDWMEYFIFVSGRLESYLLPIGFILMAIALSLLPSKY